MIQPNIGLSEKERFGSADILNKLLADEFLLYAKTRNYHWNVTGPRFNDLHKFFESQYEVLDDIMDDVAERVRKMGFHALGSMAQFIKMSRLKEPIADLPDDNGMLKSLLDDHETIIRNLREDLDKDDKVFHDAGTVDFVTSVMQEHEKMAWMIRSYFN